MGKKVDEYMNYKIDISNLMVTTDTKMIDIVKLMVEQNSRTVVVTDANRRLEGIITGTDILRELGKDINPSSLRDGVAEHVMTKKATYVPTGTLMLEVAAEMERRRIHTIIVTNAFNPVGILTQMDVIRWWLEEHGQGTQDTKKR